MVTINEHHLTNSWNNSVQFEFCRVHYERDVREHPDDIRGQHDMFLIFSILATIITVFLIGAVIFLRKRIKLVITLFKEAGKAATNMPLLLLEPVLVSKNC